VEPDSAGGFTWRYKWVRHKTLGACGARVCKLHLSKEILQKLPDDLVQELNTRNGDSVISQNEEITLKKFLRDKGIKKHSLRRSGIKFWENQGLTIENLRAISLHGSTKTLSIYLD
jgi:hypothetical protein